MGPIKHATHLLQELGLLADIPDVGEHAEVEVTELHLIRVLRRAGNGHDVDEQRAVEDVARDVRALIQAQELAAELLEVGGGERHAGDTLLRQELRQAREQRAHQRLELAADDKLVAHDLQDSGQSCTRGYIVTPDPRVSNTTEPLLIS